MCSSLKVLAVIPVVLLMLAGQEVGEAVTLALEQSDEVVGAVIPLLEHQLRVVHLLLRGHHLCGEGSGQGSAQVGFSKWNCWRPHHALTPGRPSRPTLHSGATAQECLPSMTRQQMAVDDGHPLTECPFLINTKVSLDTETQMLRVTSASMLDPCLPSSTPGVTLQTAPPCRGNFFPVLPSVGHNLVGSWAARVTWISALPSCQGVVSWSFRFLPVMTKSPAPESTVSIKELHM